MFSPCLNLGRGIRTNKYKNKKQNAFIKNFFQRLITTCESYTPNFFIKHVRHIFVDLILFFLNLPYFISKRLTREKQAGFSRLIVHIAIAAVAVSIMVMILALAIVKGYQAEVGKKLIGFNAHIQV